MDWSIYFLAQFRYLELNEVQLSLVAVLSALTQFLMLGVWTQISSARGVRFVFVIGAAGFAFCSLTILFAMMMPPSIGIIFYYVFHCIGSSTFSAFQLSLLLCLLEVIPNVDKTLSIAIYSTVILMSNAVMPFLGVHIYNLLGENRQAMIITIGIVSAIRIAATIAALVRYYVYKNRDDLLPQK
jgi:MFS family permease